MMYGPSEVPRDSGWFIFTLNAKSAGEYGFRPSKNWDHPNKDNETLYCICMVQEDLVNSANPVISE